MSKNLASIIAVLGASGSGKSAWIKRQFAKHRRIIIWDAMHEYGAHGVVVSELARMCEIIAAGKQFAIVFQPVTDTAKRQQQFDMFCRIALAAGNLLLVVEELRFVTTPSRAPVGWAQVCLTGRHKGLKVIGASQRPASIDKDFLGNATVIHVGRLVYPEDVRAVSRASQIPEAQIADLKPLDWIEKDMTAGKFSRGRLTF